MAGIDDGRGAWEKVVGGRGAGTPTTPRPQPTRKGIHYLPQALRPLGAGRAREHRELGAKRRRATRAGPVETPAPVRTGAGLPTGWRCWKRMARSSAPGAPLVVLVRRLAGRVEGGGPSSTHASIASASPGPHSPLQPFHVLHQALRRQARGVPASLASSERSDAGPRETRMGRRGT